MIWKDAASVYAKKSEKIIIVNEEKNEMHIAHCTLHTAGTLAHRVLSIQLKYTIIAN